MKSHLTSRTVRHVTLTLETEDEVRALEWVLVAARESLGNDFFTASLRAADRQTADPVGEALALVDGLQALLRPVPHGREIQLPGEPARPDSGRREEPRSRAEAGKAPKKVAKPALFRRHRA